MQPDISYLSQTYVKFLYMQRCYDKNFTGFHQVWTKFRNMDLKDLKNLLAQEISHRNNQIHQLLDILGGVI